MLVVRATENVRAVQSSYYSSCPCLGKHGSQYRSLQCHYPKSTDLEQIQKSTDRNWQKTLARKKITVRLVKQMLCGQDGLSR
jgi:hypothetical protein